MSNATGAIRFKDGTIRFYEYYGTSDICDRTHYATMAEVSANWRKYPENKCMCGKLETVEVYSSYGGGFYFTGQACKACGFLDCGVGFDTLDPDETEDWAKEVFKSGGAL